MLKKLNRVVKTVTNGMDLKGKKILVVDDEPDLRELVSFEFEMAGCEILMAENGREAFEVYQKKSPAAIVTDIRMPGGDGIELLESVYREPGNKPVFIFITGFADLTLDDALEKGAEGLFSKPYDRKALVATVDRNLVDYKERWSQAAPQTGVSIERSFSTFDDLKAEGEFELGRGGFCLLIPNGVLPASGESIQFSFEFSDSTLPKLSGVGEVRWVRRGKDDGPRGMGVEFFSVQEGLEELRALLLKHAPRAFIPSLRPNEEKS